jgi:hypothetical protein
MAWLIVVAPLASASIVCEKRFIPSGASGWLLFNKNQGLVGGGGSGSGARPCHGRAAGPLHSHCTQFSWRASLAPPISTLHPQTSTLRCTRYLHGLSRKGRRCCGKVLLQRHLAEFST